ncbi:MAG: hypothetical protein ACRDQ1_18970, partial [Sciscionella sp.]
MWIGAGVVVILVAGGLASWQLLSGDSKPKLTYQGKQIADPATVLQEAETSVAAVVKKRHGVSNGDTRCYFSQPDKVPSGQKKSDVDDKLLCGPVLFVDGDDSTPYLGVPLQSSQNGKKVTLTPSSSLDDTAPTAVPDSAKLVRPDGASAPKGADGLKVPQPPPADKDVLVAAPLGGTSPPPAVDNAIMVSRNESVTVKSAGVIARYGSGEDARSAPAGEELLAFRIATDEGDIGSSPSADALTVAVDGGEGRAIPDISDPDDFV